MTGQQAGLLTCEQLMVLFQVGPDDLAANRAGRMGERQRHLLMRKARLLRAIMLLVVLPFIVLMGVVSVWAFVDGPPVFGVVMLGLMGLTGWLTLRAYNAQMRPIRAGIDAGVVEQISGACTAHTRTTGSGRVWITVYWLDVDGRRILITKQQYIRLKSAPGAYTVYYDPATNETVAMEPLSD